MRQGTCFGSGETCSGPHLSVASIQRQATINLRLSTSLRPSFRQTSAYPSRLRPHFEADLLSLELSRSRRTLATMAGNIMNQNFGSDDEDEEDFNPEPEVASDEEGGYDGGDDVKAEEKPSRRVDTIPDEDDDDEVQAPSKPQRKLEDDDDDADMNGVKEADGVDDEDEGAGEGDDDGVGDDDEDDEEDEDEDDEDVAVSPAMRSGCRLRRQFSHEEPKLTFPGPTAQTIATRRTQSVSRCRSRSRR